MSQDWNKTIREGTLDPIQLYLEGQRKKQEEKQEQEKAKLGQLRGGSCGLLTPSGEVVGKCHRLSWLRLQGIAPGPHPGDEVAIQANKNKLFMFEGGEANELVWSDILTAGETPFDVEPPGSVAWSTLTGTPVSGRPDILLGSGATSASTEYTQGLELKAVSSVWTAREVLFQARPKLDHAIQSTHYMWKTGLPFSLCYVSRVNYAVPDWAKKKGFFPSQGEHNSQYVGYNEKGEIKHVEPFLVAYDLRLINGTLEYRGPNTPEYRTDTWTKTSVTLEQIEDYYSYVSDMDSAGLGSRPVARKINGRKENYSPCDYCSASDVCDRWERNPQEWLSQMKGRHKG
jgi:hypothetical protein